MKYLVYRSTLSLVNHDFWQRHLSTQRQYVQTESGWAVVLSWICFVSHCYEWCNISIAILFSLLGPFAPYAERRCFGIKWKSHFHSQYDAAFRMGSMIVCLALFSVFVTIPLLLALMYSLSVFLLFNLGAWEQPFRGKFRTNSSGKLFTWNCGEIFHKYYGILYGKPIIFAVKGMQVNATLFRLMRCSFFILRHFHRINLVAFGS